MRRNRERHFRRWLFRAWSCGRRAKLVHARREGADPRVLNVSPTHIVRRGYAKRPERALRRSMRKLRGQPEPSEIAGPTSKTARLATPIRVSERWMTARSLGDRRFRGSCLGFTLGAVLTPWWPAPPFDLRHPGRWSATTSSAASRQSLQCHDRLFNLLTLEA